MSDAKGIVARPGDIFPEEVLKEQDGKKVPLRVTVGGPIIGEAVLSYNSDEQALTAELQVRDTEVERFLKGPSPSVIFKKDR